MITIARKVKCAVTGSWGTTDTFVKIGNKYYESTELYQKVQKQKDLHRHIVDYVCRELLDYQTGQVFPTVLTKKLKELSFYDSEVILKTLQLKDKDIRYYLSNKNFDSDYGKIAYIFGIVKNSINDVYLQGKREKKVELSTPTEIDADFISSHDETASKGKNISNWLEEDDL